MLIPEAAQLFRINGASITLHRHQAQAVAKAASGQGFAVTTGTGSGKSLCFFIPIINAAIRARKAGEAARTRAIHHLSDECSCLLYALATFPELKEFDLIDSITQLVAFMPRALMLARQKHRPMNL